MIDKEKIQIKKDRGCPLFSALTFYLNGELVMTYTTSFGYIGSRYLIVRNKLNCFLQDIYNYSVDATVPRDDFLKILSHSDIKSLMIKERITHKMFICELLCSDKSCDKLRD